MYWEQGGELVSQNSGNAGGEIYAYNTLMEYFNILVETEKNRIRVDTEGVVMD